jgi:hypothetical protein
MTPASCAAEQAERTDLKVLRCIYMVAADGHGADLNEVRDLLILCHGLKADEAEVAIAEATIRGLIAAQS